MQFIQLLVERRFENLFQEKGNRDPQKFQFGLFMRSIFMLVLVDVSIFIEWIGIDSGVEQQHRKMIFHKEFTRSFQNEFVMSLKRKETSS